MKPVKLLKEDVVKLIDLSYSELRSGSPPSGSIYLEECRVVLINQSYVSKLTERLFGKKVILDLIVFVKSISNYVRVSSQFVEFVERKGELPLSNRLVIGDIVEFTDLRYNQAFNNTLENFGCALWNSKCEVRSINNTVLSHDALTNYGKQIILDLVVHCPVDDRLIRTTSNSVKFIRHGTEAFLAPTGLGIRIETQTGRMASGDKDVMQGVAYPIYPTGVGKNRNLDFLEVFRRGSTLIIDTESTKNNFWNDNVRGFKANHPYNNAQINTNQPNNTDMKKETKTTSIDVEALLKEAEINGMNSMLKEALTEEKRRSDEDKKRNLIEYIQSIKSTTAVAVEHLRDARRQERLAKTHLQEIAAAEQEFYKDVDYVKYSEAVNAATEKYYSQK